MGAAPARTCIGCRNRGDRNELLRLVQQGSTIVPDVEGRLPGRGAYLHPTLECLAVARKRRAYRRAFRTGDPLTDQAVAALLQQSAQNGDEMSAE